MQNWTPPMPDIDAKVAPEGPLEDTMPASHFPLLRREKSILYKVAVPAAV